MIKFSHTIFYVSSVADAVKFYKKAFDISPKFVHETNTYAELATEGVTLAFASEDLGDMNLPQGYQRNTLLNPPQGCEIVFTTDNPQALYEKALQAGAISVSIPKIKPWGQEVAYVRDPFGILIEIASVMGVV